MSPARADKEVAVGIREVHRVVHDKCGVVHVAADHPVVRRA